MATELRLEQRREAVSTVVVPDSVAQQIIDQDLTAAPVVFEDKSFQEQELYRAAVELPGIMGVQFSLLYRKYQDPWPFDYDAMQFDYERVHGDVHFPIATLEFDRTAPRWYRLRHRYVEPQYRDRRGIGTQLLRQAEAVFQQIADRTNEQQRLEIELGQRSVLQWIMKNGFVPEAVHAQTIRRVFQHPEQFIFRDIIDRRDTLKKTDCIFPLGTTHFTLEKTVRLQLYKIITPQRSQDWAYHTDD